MKQLIPSTRFKKDLKRYQHNKKFLDELYIVFGFLMRDEELPAKYKKHQLIGNYINCYECHIENDRLLIWKDENSNIISLVRLGTHSELF
jgi:mRNA interferase YafQ